MNRRHDLDDDFDDFDDFEDELDVDVDVCQHCGRYFAWMQSLRETWERVWKPGPNERQPQRCHACLVDDTWIEGRQ